MSHQHVDRFIEQVQDALQKNALSYRLQTIIHSPKSFKANFHFHENLFLAVRYNARNGRTDFALIFNKSRVFGYDNLNDWHYHPFENPSEHIFCKEPGIDKIISEIKSVVDKL
jgi:hypothetical protein